MNEKDLFPLPHGPLKNVVLEGGFTHVIGSYGATVKINDPIALGESILLAVLQKGARLAADEISYLREWRDYLQSDLATVLGVDVQTVSLWERGAHRIPRSCDTLLRALIIEKLPRKLRPSKKESSVEFMSKLAERDATARYIGNVTDAGNWHISVVLHHAQYFGAKSSSAKVVAFSGVPSMMSMQRGAELVARERGSVGPQTLTEKYPRRNVAKIKLPYVIPASLALNKTTN